LFSFLRVQMKIKTILPLFLIVAFSACQSNQQNTPKSEDEELVDDLLKRQQEKSDSAKKALGIE